MALKKSELYSFLWKSCDELRGGVTAAVLSNKTNKQISEQGNAAQPADPATRYDHV